MRGTVIKRGQNWQALWYTGRTVNGKQERKSKSGFRTRKEAMFFLCQQAKEV